MTGNSLLDWSILAVSLFNTILMVWLGLTVWLNAAGRTGGVWLTSLSLFAGGAFFVSHTVIVGQALSPRPGLEIWWRAGLWAVIILPFAWYSVTLWHAGFWNQQPSALRTRHRPLLALSALMLLGLGGLLVSANPLPTFSHVLALSLAPTPTLVGWPLLVVAYPIYSAICLLLALDALLRPGPAARLGGQAARRRARPWLVGATLLLISVSLVVAGVLAWLVRHVAARDAALLDSSILLGLGLVDVWVAGMLAGVLVLVGQAIVTYEVFTGQTLPRRGLQRYWRRALLLAAGYGTAIGWALAAQLQPVYIILLTALVTTVFYALLSWRAYTERERAMRQLRPFVASERRYETVLAPEAQPVDTALLFQTLCRDVLNAQRAYLVALGPLAPLAGSPLVFPPQHEWAAPDMGRLAAQFTSPQVMSVPLDPAQMDGLHWAVPLWSERGLIGVLLLGEKGAGGLYSQEEMEIARASGERLLDAQASAELLRRLMTLQRQRLAESQLTDHRVRRELHDDILPRLHTAMLELRTGADSQAGLQTLAEVHHRLADLLRAMPPAAPPPIARLGLFGALRQFAEGDLPHAFDHVEWEVPPGADEQARGLPAFAAETVYFAAREAMRNAAHHARGRETMRPLRLRVAAHVSDDLRVIIEDTGVGVTRAGEGHAGAGQGLALHSTLMAVLGGTLVVESQPGAYTRIVLSLPLKLAQNLNLA